MERKTQKFSPGCLEFFDEFSLWRSFYFKMSDCFVVRPLKISLYIFVFSFFFMGGLFFDDELYAISLKNSSPIGAEKFSSAFLIQQIQEDVLRFPDEPPLEPEAYRKQDYRGLVPTTLRGAKVVGDHEAVDLYKQGNVIFIDVMPYTPKPPNLPKTMIWRETVRKNIKGSIWLANVGYGVLPPEMELYFKRNLQKLTKGDTSQPLLFYCQEKCWMSWNAAKRALEFGYRTVYWYPDGTDGWMRLGGEVVNASPMELPQMTRALTQ